MSNSTVEEIRLNELKKWLLNCNYPLRLINSAFHKAKLQGPANKKVTDFIPFVTTHSCNLDYHRTIKIINDRLSSSNNPRIKKVYGNASTVLSLKQPPNILKQLTRAEFKSNRQPSKCVGLFKCSDKRCKICKLYIQECKSFLTANGKEWFVRSHITCQTRCVIYYLECIPCDGKTTYCGKTNNLRKRINCHISEILSGNTTNIFDRHVHSCQNKLRLNQLVEPYFRLFILLEVPEEKLLLPYESYFHSQKIDTMN